MKAPITTEVTSEKSYPILKSCRLNTKIRGAIYRKKNRNRAIYEVRWLSPTIKKTQQKSFKYTKSNEFSPQILNQLMGIFFRAYKRLYEKEQGLSSNTEEVDKRARESVEEIILPEWLKIQK